MIFFIFQVYFKHFIVAYSPLSHRLLENIIFVVIEMEDTLLKSLGINIKIKRINLGLSQEKFALQIGMDRTYFSAVESGKRNISIKNLKKIADGLNITLSELFENI